MIRFGVIVTVVVAAVGLLAVGAVAGDLTLVYVSIALAAVALLLLIVGVAVWRDEVFASSARRDERDLAAVGAVGQAGRAGTGRGAAEGWPDRPAPAPWAVPSAAGPELQGGDTREFGVPVGALPDRDAPLEHRRSGEPWLADQPQRPAEQGGRPGREVRRRERPGRDAGPEDWPGRDLAAADRPGRDAGPEDWPGRDLAAADRPGRDAAALDRPGRDAAALDRPGRDAVPGERSASEAAASDRAARETISLHRPDRAERYPIVFGPERYESADDPTRLAHRLESLTDFGRQADPDAPGSARSRAEQPGGQRPPAPIDPLAGPVGDRRPAADPLAGSPSAGRAAARPTGLEQGNGADADAPRPSRALSPTPPVPTAAPAAPAPGTTPPGTTAPAQGMERGSRGLVPPAESGSGRPESGRDWSDRAATDSPGGSPARPQAASWAGTRLPAEAASSAVGDLAFPAAPARAPAGRDEGPAIAPRSPAVSSAPAAPSAAATAPADTVGTAAASEPGASAGTGPAQPATAGTAATDAGAAAAPAIGLDDHVSVVPGIARYHKADCILIRFLSEDDLEVTTRRDAEAAGSAPCRACRPDQPATSD